MRFSAPFRLFWVWCVAAHAVNERRRQEAKEVAEAKAERVRQARGLLFKDGTMRRVAAVRRAIRRPEFHDRFMACDRAGAKRLEDLCEMAVGVLLEMGIEMRDVQLTMRRTSDTSLKFDPLPSLEVARRALARVDGQGTSESGVPLDELLAGAVASAGAGAAPTS